MSHLPDLTAHSGRFRSFGQMFQSDLVLGRLGPLSITPPLLKPHPPHPWAAAPATFALGWTHDPMKVAIALLFNGRLVSSLSKNFPPYNPLW